MKRTSVSASPQHLAFEGAVDYGVTKAFRLFDAVHLGDGNKQVTLVAKDGVAYQAIGPARIFPTRGKEMEVPIRGTDLDFSALGITSAAPIGQAPMKVIEEMWP